MSYTFNPFTGKFDYFKDSGSGGSFWAANGNDIYNTNTGNVGIGTTTPAYKLEVLSPGTSGLDIMGRFRSASDYVSITVDAIKGGNLGQSSITFAKNGTNTWALGSDFAANGTKDFFIYDGTANAARLYIDTSGYIGIGTTTPAAILDVKFNDETVGPVFRNTATSGPIAGILTLGSTQDDYNWYQISGMNYTWQWGTFGSNQLRIGNSVGSPYVVIESDGSVGIGTTSPDHTLTIEADNPFPFAVRRITSATGGTGMQYDGPAAIWSIGLATVAQAGRFFFRVNGISASEEVLTILTDGKLGILNVTPAYSLDVTGDGHITGAFYDSTNSPGTSGQVLSSTVTGTLWSPAGASGTNVYNEVVVFIGTSGNLANTPTSGTVRLYRGGLRQNPGGGNDYTISSATLTLASAASSGEVFLADYTY